MSFEEESEPNKFHADEVAYLDTRAWSLKDLKIMEQWWKATGLSTSQTKSITITLEYSTTSDSD